MKRSEVSRQALTIKKVVGASALAFFIAGLFAPAARSADSYERDASVAAMQFMESRGMPGGGKSTPVSVLDMNQASRRIGGRALKDALAPVSLSRRVRLVDSGSVVAVPQAQGPAASQPKTSLKDRIKDRVKARLRQAAQYVGKKTGKAATDSEQVLGASVVGGSLGAAAGFAIGGVVGALVLGYLGSVAGAALQGYRMGRKSGR